MTGASGQPYAQHGTPRLPNRPQPQAPSYVHSSYYQQQQQNNRQISGGYTNNGFTPATLTVPTNQQLHPITAQPIGQALPVQHIRPVQPVQVR